MKRIAVGLFLWMPTAARAEAPRVFSYTGTLAEASGTPVPDSNYDMTFRFFDSIAGGTAFWENAYSVPTIDGVFTAFLGTNSATLDPSLFAREQVWLEITVEGETLEPRLRVVSVPYALAAASLDCQGCVQGSQVDPSQVQVRVAGACAGGQAVTAIHEDGSVDCGGAGGLSAGPGIDITGGVISTSFTPFSCTSPDKICGFDVSGFPQCCADLSGGGAVNFHCPLTDKVAGWDLTGVPICEPEGGGGGGTVTQVNAGAGLAGGPITEVGTLSIAAGGVETAMIEPGAVSTEMGTADLVPLCTPGGPGPSDECTIGVGTVVLFERMVLDPGLYLFFVHLNGVKHDTALGSLGLQLNNATTNAVVDPDSAFETWDYTFEDATDRQSISRVFMYEKPTVGLETLQVRAWTDGGFATIQPYSTLGGHNAGMRVVVLKR